MLEGPTRQGAHPPISWPPRGSSDVNSKSPGSYSSKKSRCRIFHSVWTPFDIPFLRNTETGNKAAIWVIHPFYIIILYQYLLHYGLLLHIISQYLWLFSLILPGLHEEGNAGSWNSGLEKEQILETYSAHLQKS